VVGGHSLVFGAPSDYILGLVNYNFKSLNLANNHALDQGIKGLEYTLNYLDEKNIKHVGAGKNLNEAWQPAIVETRGIKICFIGASYASINDSGKTQNNYVARIDDNENLKLAIQNSKSLCNFVVTTMHAGTEYTRKPNNIQIQFAHNAIDFGADVVIGAHPHWVQTIEKYKDKYIFYSLGNFIFDQEWSQETKEGLALKIQVSKANNQNSLQGTQTFAKLENIELIPVILENYSTPRPANEDEAKKILKKIGLDSQFLY
jgi:poly-gamma-glutamate synthesis protein (capsule biosynthesis protein)